MKRLASRVLYLPLLVTVLMLCSCGLYPAPPGPPVPAPVPIVLGPISVGYDGDIYYLARRCGCVLRYPGERYDGYVRAVFASCINGVARMNLNGRDVRLRSIGTAFPGGPLRVGDRFVTEYEVAGIESNYPYYGPGPYAGYYPEYGTSGYGEYYPGYGTIPGGAYYPEYEVLPYGGYYPQYAQRPTDTNYPGYGPRPIGTNYPDYAPIPSPSPVATPMGVDNPGTGEFVKYLQGYPPVRVDPIDPGFNFNDLRVRVEYMITSPCPIGVYRCRMRWVGARIEVLRNGAVVTSLPTSGACGYI